MENNKQNNSRKQSRTNLDRSEVLCDHIFALTQELIRCQEELIKLRCVGSCNGVTKDEWNNLVFPPVLPITDVQSLLQDGETPCMLLAGVLQASLSNEALSDVVIQSCWQMNRGRHAHWYISGVSVLPQSEQCYEDCEQS